MPRRLFSAVAAVAMLFGGAPFAGAQAAAPWDPYFATWATAVSFADLGSNPRPFGVAAGDFDNDGTVDIVAGAVSGRVYFTKGLGNGAFATRQELPGKQTSWNVSTLASADVNGDGHLDVVWGATAATSGCSISPIPTGQTCATAGGAVVTVNDGDVRAFLGNGDGTFVENTYFVSGVRHNAGVLLARPGTADAGSITSADVDGDHDTDIVVGAIDGTSAVVRLLRNAGGTFGIETIASVTAGASGVAPLYYPPTTAAASVSPWGLSLGDVDGDGDLDLWVGDRALYIYLYVNNGAGIFTLLTPVSPPLPTRPNVLLAHDAYRAAVGYTPALGSADLNGDGKADLVIGLQSGNQNAAVTHDGEILLRLSTPAPYVYGGATVMADIGMVARGVNVLDVNGDGARDIIAGEFSGTVAFLRQLPPMDTDDDGISDYVDNAPGVANLPRIDLNTDGAVTARDQLDNDFDTVLGNPEFPATWQRLGDPADDDDDNDGVVDTTDNCPFVANGGQADADGDGRGNACDPLDDRDRDGDGTPDGPAPGDPLFEAAQRAATRWSQGTTRFVVRIDALGRFFQNEFTQILTDAAVLSSSDWAAKCWENYDPADFASPYEPCGDDASKTLTLEGGREVPVSLAVIPKQLWTDPPVVTWINDRNDYAGLEIVQHGTYHVNNTPLGDWADAPDDRRYYSCETCGLSEAENFELLRVGFDTLLGNYGNKWVAESGATSASPTIDWLTSANPLISYAPPYNASDTMSRLSTAQLGYKGFSASRFEEEEAYLGWAFSPEGSHMERFDQFGMFHASADLQVDPPDTPGDVYDSAAYRSYLQSITQPGGLNTWLIEEVEWSGRPDNTSDRTESNRENNTVYLPRWSAWLDLLDFIKTYPGGVALTLGDVALAKAYDNAPTVANPDQADADHDGIGDVIDGAAITVPPVVLNRNVAGTLSATLLNGSGQPIVGQVVEFSIDADGDGSDETYSATTDASGLASASVTPTRPVGTAPYAVAWDGVRVVAQANGEASVADATFLSLDATNPPSGQVTDAVLVGATLRDSSGTAVAGQTVAFTIGAATGTGTTDGAGHASAMVTLAGPAGATHVSAAFAGSGPYGPSSASAAFAVQKEDTRLTVTDAVASKNNPAPLTARLVDDDVPAAAVAGKTIEIQQLKKVRGTATWTTIATAVTNADGIAVGSIPSKYVSVKKEQFRAFFPGDDSFAAAEGFAYMYR